MSEEAMNYGWKQARSSLGFFFMYLIAVGPVLMGWLGATAGLAPVESARYPAVIPFLACCVAALVVGLGSLNISLKVNRGEKPGFSDIWPGMSTLASSGSYPLPWWHTVSLT